MDWLTPERYASELEAETARLAAAVTAQRPEARVPTCPEWTVRDLVTHVGTGHRYAAGIIEAGADAPVPYQRVPAPDDPAQWTAWLAEGAARLNAAVRAHGFDGAIWTWNPDHRTAGFWLRRMVHDEIIHRFDAEPDGDLAIDLAADGVADLLLTTFIFKDLTGDGETLRFTATDAGRQWLVTLTPDGVRWHEEGTGGKSDAAIAEPARDLLLVLNRRREPSGVEGDHQLFAKWREGTKF